MRKLSYREIFDNGALRLLTVDSVECHRLATKRGLYVYVQATPIAVLVDGPNGLSALDLESMPMDIDALRAVVPGLDELVHDR